MQIFPTKPSILKKEFEKLLSDAVTLSEGIISHNLLCSGELVTEFTLPAEKTTEAFTGIGINKGITARELRLVRDCRQGSIGEGLRCKVQRLNRRALELLDGLIAFKELILRNVLCCQMFTMNYPLLIEHIIREAKLYREYVSMLERDGCLTDNAMRDTECFWNRIMMEHAMFIRGLLDPTEEDLINTADSFAKDYSNLLSACNSAQRRTLQTSSLDETLKFRDFKMAGTKGIEECKIRSVILPLLADHVLREANHYIRLLQCE